MTGSTKRDSPISWRPSSEARLALAELLKADLGLKRNELLNRLVIRAAGSGLPSPQKQAAIRKKAYAAQAERRDLKDIVEGNDPVHTPFVSDTTRRVPVPKPGWKK